MEKEKMRLTEKERGVIKRAVLNIVKNMFLTINCGSSSVRAALFSLDSSGKLSRLWEKHLPSHDLESLLSFLPEHPTTIGHRVVHGGARFRQTTQITEEILHFLTTLSPLAPLHNTYSLKGIEVAKRLFPKASHFAVFDTAFYAGFPQHVALYPIPFEIARKHEIRRYGFHGISHAYLWRRYLEMSGRKGGRVLSLHLGSGCSITATVDGIPIDTTMGFTPLEGVMMGTRSGSIDPSLVPYIATKEGISAEKIISLLNEQSGLLGISGLTGDMQTLLKEKTPMAELAIEMFLHSLIKAIGSLFALLGSIDALLFSGGIGENSPEIRKRLVEKLPWLSVSLDEEANQTASCLSPGTGREISTSSSITKIFAIASDENLAIAEEIS
ncbi:MAG: acetate/propionate family kinase [Verrucomicrobiota bacterium]|nr:acetate/propionate family kinase [Verrucomicrobiota bacterium]